MSSKYNPPKFIDDAAGYSDYKKKLQRWTRITKVDSKQQAEVVLYHLEGHPSGIQEKIDTALGDEIIDKDDAMTKLIAYLDSIYEEDEMTNMWMKYKKIVRLKKSEEQTINEFIAEFETAYKEAKNNGCEVSDTVLALNLLESCKLSDTDEKFVLTAVDFKEGKQKNDCLEQVKRSLRKFQSRDRMSADKDSDRFQLKQEDTLVANVKEALLADGWRPPPGQKPSTSGSQNSPAYKGKKNKLGSNGKPLTCFHCQSEYHFAFDCDKKESNVTDKEKKSKTKKKPVEPTMFTQLLSSSKRDYAMVCQVYEGDNVNELNIEVVNGGGVDNELNAEEVSGGLVDNEMNLEVANEKELVLVSHIDEEELVYLVEEAGSRGVLDSACSKSVAGLSWIDKYTKAISLNFGDALVLKPSSKVFQFGGGEKRESKGCVTLPTLIGDKKVFITMDVVDAPIPLLIGSNSMEAGSAILNFQTHEATFFNEVVPMVKVGTGHYCIDLASENLLSYIADVEERDQKVENVLVSTSKIKVTDLRKLHHYYGHTSPEKLLKFLKKAGKETEGLRAELIKIESSCESCNRSKRRKPRPQSAIPRVEGPNEIVTIDLKHWNGKGKKRYICYIIDMHSRLTSAGFISDKKPDTIVDCILQHWIPVFGIMKGIHSDIGGELSNSVMEDVAHKLGVELTTTAAYSPHQNGLNERNHAVVDLMITRMMASDKNLLPDMALLWALNAKNSLDNLHGFSSFQLHIGRNPSLPSATRDGPPSYENTSISKNFVSHMNAMMSAREQFIKAESSFSLKKALKSKVHPRGNDIQEGDMIYYKKDEGKGKNVLWSGPSKVTSVNGKKLFIDQGARLGTVNRDDAVRIGEEFWRMDKPPEHRALEDIQYEKVRRNGENRTDRDLGMSTQQKGAKAKEGVIDVSMKVSRRVSVIEQLESSSSESDSEDEQEETEEEGEEDVDDEEDEGTHEGEGIVEEEEVNEQEDDNSELEDQESVEGSQGGDNNEREVVVEEGSSEERVRSSDAEVRESEEESAGEVNDDETEYEDASKEVPGVSSEEVQVVCKDIQVGDVISYQIPKTGVVESGKVLSRAGKSSGSNKFWWNIEVQSTGEQKSIDTKAVRELKKVTGVSVSSHTVCTLIVSVPRYLHNEPECMEAKQKELDNWKDFGVFTEIEDIGQKTINTSWVLVRKDTGVKARLCIRGDQEPNKEQIRTDSPTVNKVNIKLFYLIATYKGWVVQSADVKAAFLQGADLERDVFVRPPSECRVPGIIWKMIKRAYGFVDASRGFYIELEKVILNVGCKVSRNDPAMYLYFNPMTGLLSGMILTHVDDLLHGSGDKEFHENVMEPLKRRFKFGSEEEEDFMYVGMHVVQVGDSINIDQNHYVEDLEVPYMEPYIGTEDLDALLDEEGQALFRTTVGRIGWVANSTRPDMAYDNLVLSMRLGKASLRDMKQACRIIKKIKCEGTSMKFVNLGLIEEWTLQGFGDAGFKSMPDKTSSCGGQVILLSNVKKGLACVLDWKSNKLKRVVSSSTAAEALAANDTLDGMVYVQSVLTELLGERASNIPLVLATDAKNLHKIVMNSTLVQNPRLRTDIAKLKESLQFRELSKFVHVAGTRMIADVLTKKGAPGFKLMNVLRTSKL